MKNFFAVLLQALLLVGILSAMAVPMAHADTVTGISGTAGAMPWDTAIGNLVAVLTGKWAGAIGLIAVIAAAMMLIFGRDWSAFVQTLIYLIFGIGLLVGAGAFYNAMFADATTAAVISAEQVEQP